MDATINEFLAARPVAVVGASPDRSKYGNIVMRNLRGRGWEVFAVNPKGGIIEDQPAYPSLADCPKRPELVVMVTPPSVTMKVMDEAKALGIQKIWMQPGAESPEAVAHACDLGLRVVSEACIMVMAARKRG